MTSTWTLKENSTGELEVTVEGEAWKKAQKKALNYAKSHMNLKGFRQGQIPDALVKKQLSSKALYDMASEEVANEALSEGIKEHNIDLVARPTLDVKEADDEKAVLVFTCTVLPEVTLGEYKGLDIKKADVEVTEEDVENEVKRVQDRYADWVVREDDDAAQLGDQVVIDFVGTKDGVAFEGGSGENYPLELGSGSFIPGFEDQMIGMKVNETRDLNLTFPENYQAAELAGQDVVFKVTVKKLSVKKDAELNDAFVEGLGVPEIKTVEDLKAYINEGLQQQHDQQYETQKENTIFDAFMADSEVELDDDAIDEALDRQMSYMANQMMAQGIQLDQYLQMTGMDEEKLREQMKPSATQQAKLEALIDEIIAVEKIGVTEEVLDEQLNMVGQANQMTKEQVLEKIDLEGFKRDLSRMQASRLIVNNAVEK